MAAHRATQDALAFVKFQRPWQPPSTSTPPPQAPPPAPTHQFSPALAPPPLPMPNTSPAPGVLSRALATPSERPAKRTRFDFREDITVLVGAEEKRYSVHKKIVCQASDFFRAACTGEWKENREQVVKLPEIEAAIFEVYVCWIYTNEIDIASKATDTEVSTTKYEKHMDQKVHRELLRQLISAFALGDILQDITFKNAVVDEYVALSIESMIVTLGSPINLLMETVPQSSTLVKAIVDDIAVNYKQATLSQMLDQLPKAFVLELARACIRDRELTLRQRGIVWRARCFYHDHPDGKGKTKFCSG